MAQSGIHGQCIIREHLPAYQKTIWATDIAQEDSALPEASMTVNQMRRSLQSHKQWFNSFGIQLESQAQLYAWTGMKAVSAAMQDTVSKFRPKGAFLEKAYHQLIRMDPTREADYEAENKALLNKCHAILDIGNMAIWAQKKAAPSVKPGDEDGSDRTVRVRSELWPEELTHENEHVTQMYYQIYQLTIQKIVWMQEKTKNKDMNATDALTFLSV